MSQAGRCGGRGGRAAVVACASVAAFGLLAAPPAAAAFDFLQPETTLPVELPDALHGGTAVWDGMCRAFVFGTGWPGWVYEVSPRDGGHAAFHPWTWEVEGMAVAWLDGAYYSFGGASNQLSNRVVRFGQGNHEPVAQLDDDIREAGIATVGNAIYIFGGDDNGAGSDRIYRFQPPADLVQLAATLPEPGRVHAVASGERVYLFPRSGGAAWAFDPATGLVSGSGLSFPHPVRWGMAADGILHVLSGSDAPDPTADPDAGLLYRIDPAAGTTELVASRPEWTSAALAFDGHETLYIIGGLDADGQPRSDIRAVGPAPDCPLTSAFTATVQPGECGGLAVTLQDISSGPGGIQYRAWAFNDAYTAGAAGDGPVATHVFLPPETAVATLLVVDGIGRGKATHEQWTVPAGACPPTLGPVAPLQVHPGQPVHVCLEAHATMAGTLAFSIPEGPAAMSVTQDGCVSWTPLPADVGAHPCITVQVMEAPSGFGTQACLSIDVLPLPLPAAPGSAGDGPALPAIPGQPPPCPDVADAVCARKAPGAAQWPGQAAPPADGAPAGSEAVGPLPTRPDDRDADGLPDAHDNCPATANPDQADQDLDRMGDLCDADRDGDGIPQDGAAGLFLDVCPDVPDALQLDADGDGVGDACDAAAGAATSIRSPRPAAARPRAAAAPGPGPTEPPGSLLAIVGGGIAALAAGVAAHRHRAPLVVLFSRLRQSDLSQQRSRARILAILDAEPGLHFRELVRRAGQSRGSVLHHLQILEGAGLVRREDAGRYVALFVTGPSARRAPHADALRTRLARDVLATAATGPPASIAELARRLGVSDRAVAYHVRRLAAHGLVTVQQAGRRREVTATAAGCAHAAARDGPPDASTAQLPAPAAAAGAEAAS